MSNHFFVVCSNSGNTKLLSSARQCIQGSHACFIRSLHTVGLQVYTEAIHQQIVSISERNGLSLSQINTYGGDNASVDHRKHYSALQKLKDALKCLLLRSTGKYLDTLLYCNVVYFVYFVLCN